MQISIIKINASFVHFRNAIQVACLDLFLSQELVFNVKLQHQIILVLYANQQAILLLAALKIAM